MPSFGRTSTMHKDTLRVELQVVCNFLIRFEDFSVICGHRDKLKQNYAYNTKKSKVRFPNSDHNVLPSNAMDLIPYDPIKKTLLWDKNNCIHFAGMVILVGIIMGFDIGWGGNWDADAEIMTDQEFQDLGHYWYKGRL